MMSSTGKKLMQMLREIDDRGDFVAGVVSNAPDDTAWQQMIDFLNVAKDEGKEVTYEMMVNLSVMLGKEFDERKTTERKARIA